MIAPDGAEVESVWEYGIKFSHDETGEFIYLGNVALPVESLEDANCPELIEAIQDLVEELIMENIITVIRPMTDEDDLEIA